MLFAECPCLLLGHAFYFLELEGHVDQVFQLFEREDAVTDSVFAIVPQLVRPAVFILPRPVLRQQHVLLLIQADALAL